MVSPVILKLQRYQALSDVEKVALDSLAQNRRYIKAGNDILDSESPDTLVRFLLQGFACRYTLIGDGRRLHTSLLMPGDELSAPATSPSRSGHLEGVRALTEVVVTACSSSLVHETLCAYPKLAEAFQTSDRVQAAILRERVVSLGLRTAKERLAHFLCEVYLRSHAIGGVRRNTFVMPLTQGQLAELLGISLVHVNRTMQSLRNMTPGLINVAEDDRIEIPNFAALAELAHFDDAYLVPPNRPPARRRLATV